MDQKSTYQIVQCVTVMTFSILLFVWIPHIVYCPTLTAALSVVACESNYVLVMAYPSSVELHVSASKASVLISDTLFDSSFFT